jgi:hypothetical protein
MLPLPSTATLAEVVAELNSDGLNGAAFEVWYEAAVKKDPGLLPVTGADVWIVGTGLSKGLGVAATGSATDTVQAATGAEEGANQIAKDLDPFNWIAQITGFSGTNFVIRAVKVIVGSVLLISGLIHLSGIDKDALGIASKIPVIPA